MELRTIPIPSKRNPITRAIKAKMDAYSEAYHALHGCYPCLSFVPPYVHIRGEPQGVTPQRLKEMTRQLKWRSG